MCLLCAGRARGTPAAEDVPLQIRPGIARISFGMNLGLAVLSAMGFYGAVTLNQLALYGHATLAIGLVGIFSLMFLLTLTVGSDGEGGEGVEIIYVVFAFFIVDVVAGIITFRLSWLLGNYARACEDQDAAAGGPGQGLFMNATALGVLRASSGSESRLAGSAAVAPEAHPEDTGDAQVAREQYAAYIRAVQVADSEAWGHLQQGGQLAEKAAELRANAQSGGAAQPASAGYSPNQAMVLASQCGICLDKDVDTVFYDCGHLACKACAERIHSSFGHCPYCRKRIRDIVQVYVQ